MESTKAQIKHQTATDGKPPVSSRLTPKEKAWQLWNYYGTLFGRYDKAAEAAIRCVDEIHEFMRNDDDESDTCYWANHKNSNYWCDVAVELRKLS
jgi:hypothetical protein